MDRRSTLKSLSAAATIAMTGESGRALAQAGSTIKVGILHSLSGTMAISETVLKDMVMMAIDEINAKGGVMDKRLEAVVVDPAPNWPLFAEKTKQLLTQDKVSVILAAGYLCHASLCCQWLKSSTAYCFIPCNMTANEGEELSKTVFYTGAAPNQQVIPAVDYLMSKDGGGAKHWVLLGTDYVYPRTTNKIWCAYPARRQP